MKLLLLFTLLVLSSRSDAASICTDLAAHTCAKGEHHDGTGKSKMVTALAFAKSEIARIRPKLHADFSKIISGKSGKALRELAIEAFGFEEQVKCRPSSDNKKCVALIVNRMIEGYKLKEFGPEVMSNDYFFSGDAFATAKLLEDEKYQAVVQNLAQEQKASVPQGRLKKIETEIFPRIKDLLMARIRALPMNEQQKALMLKKIERTTYSGADCTPAKSDTTGIAQAFFPNAFYNPQIPSFSFCLAFLRISDSEFNIAYTIAHELSHAIEPCRFSDGSNIALSTQRKSDAEVDDSYLRKNFLRCLRSPRSANAKRLRDDTPMPPSATETLVYNDTQRLCGGDELIEAVPDWFAAEVVANYSESYLSNLSLEQKQAGFANILRPTCHEILTPDSRHPKSRNRINGILLVQPKIREQMGCKTNGPKPKTKRYCDIDNPDSLIEKPLKSSSPKPENKAVN